MLKDHKGAVRRQDENSLRALHYLATGHAFDCATGFTIIGGDEGKRGAKSANKIDQLTQVHVHLLMRVKIATYEFHSNCLF